MATILHVADNKAAIYTKPISGDPLGPFTNPENHLDLVKFHSDFDYYHLHSGPTNVTISHAQVNGQTQTFSYPGTNVNKHGRVTSVHHDLVTHSLGYIPDFIVVYNGAVVTASSIVQQTANGARFVTPYATTTKIRLFETGISSASGEHLVSASRTYSVIVFKAPVEDSNNVFTWDNATGKLTLGKGKFKSDSPMLRRAASGDSPYDLSLGPAHDIKNGGTRYVAPDGTVQTEGDYNGSFTGPSTIQAIVL